MLDEDFVCRVLLFPRYYDNGVYAPDLVMNPERVQKGVYALSVGSRAMLPNLADAHNYGHRVAEIANTLREKLERDRGRTLADNQRQIYVGFYDLLVQHIKAEETEMHSIELLHLPEHGQEEHYEIRLIEKDSIKHLPKQDRVEDREEITRLLMEKFWGACPFLDAIDVDGEEVPVNLPEGTCGPCRQDAQEAVN